MALFSKLLRRKKMTPTATPVSVSATQAPRDRSSLARVEPKTEPPPAGGESRTRLFPGKARTVAELQRSHAEVMVLVRKIGDHLDAQAGRSEHLNRTLAKLPETMDVLPSISRQNSRLLDVLTEYLEQSRDRDETLNRTLGRLTEASSQQKEVLELLEQQLDVSNQAARQMTETLGEFRKALRDLGHSNTRAVEVLSNMATAAELRESKLEMMLHRTQNWMIAALVCCGGAALTALVIAVVVGIRS